MLSSLNKDIIIIIIIILINWTSPFPVLGVSFLFYFK